MFESDFERNLFALRQEKLRQIEALGQPAYPNSFAATHSIPELRSAYNNATAEQFDANRINVAVA
ncbi:MAG: lysine--tRNA ligase, partial [Silvibacterium sp.]|nr:lysine--tRNA ligase [Silvibacterium sp.]